MPGAFFRRPLIPVWDIRSGVTSQASHCQTRTKATASRLSPLRTRKLVTPKRSPDISASQVLRFALTGTTQVPGAENYNEDVDKFLTTSFSYPLLDFVFDPTSFQKENNDLQLKPLRRSLSQYPNEIFVGARNVWQIQTALDVFLSSGLKDKNLKPVWARLQKALDTCEGHEKFKDILVILCGVVGRLENRKDIDIENLLLLGMKYASRCNAVSPLVWFLGVHRKRGYPLLTGSTAGDIIRNFDTNVQLMCWENPVANLDAIKEAITGLKGDGTLTAGQQSLVSSINWRAGDSVAELVVEYSKLLTLLGSTSHLMHLWRELRGGLKSKATGQPFQEAAVALINSLLDTGQTESAVALSKELSSFVRLDTVFSLSQLKYLVAHDFGGNLSEAIGKKSIQDILDQELLSIEKRLGVVWSGGENGRHSTANEIEFWSHYRNEAQPDSHEGVDQEHATAHSIIEAVTQHGSSKSNSELSMVVDLLNDNDGVEIPLGSRQEKGRTTEYAWFPQSSPIEFSPEVSFHHNMASQKSPNSLGLLRTRLQPSPGKLERKLIRHMIQLGYIGVRNATPATPESEKWENTGHILAWDRTERQFVVFYMGKGYGFVEPRSFVTGSHSDLPCTIATVDMSKTAGFGVSFLDLLQPLGDVHGHRVDVDPAPELQP